ncbi:putative C2H2 finger domain protein [Cladophialophora carrionii]|uniref:Putative C2H2 finger domain protein n=1 Tax=Cladophialophora carrionii TaxID=86049 RepID=A0A1C1CLC4_9EURO|nr:putative C2H2 finger domain protein [Cladophialophora carrionii]
MLALEHNRHQQFDQLYDLEQSIQAPFPGLTMDMYESADTWNKFHPLPYSFFENPSMFATAPMHSIKQEMHQFQDLPPALISSGSAPSIPSASSSTVGSPYSGPAHVIASQDGYDHAVASYGLGVMPAIVNHEAFAQDILGNAMEAELSLSSHEKLPDSFVGECADLSSSQSRPARVAPRTAQGEARSVLPLSSSSPAPCLSLTASPQSLSINTFFDQRVPTVPSVASSSVLSTAAHSPTTDQTRATPIFKSPTTPASACSRRSSVVSPLHARSFPTTLRSHTSYASHAHMSPRPAAHHAPQQHQAGHFQSHFFAQSSGNFIPPLETSYPSLIHAPRAYGDNAFSEQGPFAASLHSYTSPSVSPAPSPRPYGVYPTTQFSDPLTNANYYQQQHLMSRRPSLASYASGVSHPSPSSHVDEDGSEKGRCPHPDCGKVFKDLKAHMLTHQAERPEKCPILTCEYNLKGFARKYDKNRHTLTHYKGTMVCGFCPGSGSPAEKSFNRADVFKRHLTSVHGVEQTPPNSRKRSPSANNRKLSSYCQDATGKCSTCSATFNNAQDFYEHLDDCVLRVVQQEEPSEAVNVQHLSQINNDHEVQETLDRHMIKTEDAPTSFDDDDDDEDEDEDEDDEDEDPSFNSRSGKGALKSHKHPASARAIIGGGISKPGKSLKKGMTWSKGGVALIGKGRKKRKHYPPSWGMSAEKMRMKKRVLCVYDGQRRLWKDDMMLHNEFEVRMTLPDGKNYVTDLDVETLKRAEAFHNATAEERGHWMPTTEDEGHTFDLNALMA